MIVNYVQRGLLATLCALLITLGGCAGTPNSRFYLLEPLTGAPGPEGTVPLDRAISIGLGPVTLPEYLDRPQIVTRTDRNTVLLAEFDRWAEPLSGNVSRTLAENLTYLLHERPRGTLSLARLR